MYALAVYLARGRRRQTLMEVGLAFIAAALIVFIARSLAGHAVVNSLASTASVKPAAEAAWSIGTSVLVDIAWATVYLGIALILAGLLAGPTRAATTIRHALAPYLNERTDITFGVVVFLLLLLFVWGPIAATRTLSGIAIITVLALVGTQALRRQTLKEFPAATLPGHPDRSASPSPDG
jgi:Sec-independent protein secretion pathway component TatC